MKKTGKIAIVFWIGMFFLTSVVYAAEFDYKEGVDIHGFISQGYLYTINNNWFGNTEDGTWQFNELGINFTSMLTQRLRMGMQFFARDLGEIGNDEIVIDWAFADYNLRDWLGIRVGLLKNPMGLYGEGRDIDFLRNSVFLPQVMYIENVRDSFIQTKGAGIYGNIDANLLGMFRYVAQYGITSIDIDSGTARLFEEKTIAGMGMAMGAFGFTITDSATAGTDVDKTYTIGVDWTTPLEGLRMGGTYTRIDYEYDLLYSMTSPSLSAPIIPTDHLVMEQDIWVASIEYTWSDLVLAAEFLRTYFSTIILGEVIPFPMTYNIHGQSWYAMAAYRLFDWFTLGAYYGENYDSEDDRHGHLSNWDYPYQAWTKTTAVFARVDVNENWLMKAEYQYNDGVSLLSRKNNLDAAGNLDLDRYWHFLAFKVTFNF